LLQNDDMLISLPADVWWRCMLHWYGM